VRATLAITVYVYGMAPKSEGRPIVVRMNEDVLAALDARAKENGDSRSETIRKMVRWALAQPKGKK
jgi:metal-responsive CopG/Arc/MetJ family transcriptional regulator